MKTKSSTKQTTSGKQTASAKQATSGKETTTGKKTTTARQATAGRQTASGKQGTSSKETTAKKSTKLSTAERKQLRSSDFGIPEKREYPMPDAAHVHAAEAYFRHASATDKPLLAHRIVMKAKKYGVELDSDKIKEWAKKYKA